MRLIRIGVEKAVTCPTSAVSHWRRNNFASSSLMHCISLDTSEVNLADVEETTAAGLREKFGTISKFYIIEKNASGCASGYMTQLTSSYICLTDPQPQASHSSRGLRYIR